MADEPMDEPEGEATNVLTELAIKEYPSTDSRSSGRADAKHQPEVEAA